MAIVKMKKISIIGLCEDKESILDTLMKLGVVEIINISPETMGEELAKLVAKDGDAASVSQLENWIAKIKFAIDYLSRYENSKKGLFQPKPRMTVEKLEKMAAKRQSLIDIAEAISKHDERLSYLKSEENKLLNQIASLMPWRTLDLPLEETGTKHVVLSMGTITASFDTEELKSELQNVSPEIYLEVISTDKDQSYLLLMYHTHSAESVSKVLNSFGFTKVSFKDLSGSPQDNIDNAYRRISEIQKERIDVEKAIAMQADKIDDLRALYDCLLIDKDKKEAVYNLARTERAFLLEGWMPEESEGRIRKALARNYKDYILEINEPGEDEEYPILLKNSSLIKPFELVTELYSLPHPKGIDPNLFMAPFFFLFFGMMVSDAGYGLVMAIVTGIILWKFKPKGMAYKLIKLVFFGGISTFIWGALFGGWFGNIVDAVSSGKYTIRPLWFNPLKEPMRLLLWSFIFGLLHIFTGMGLKAYMLIRDGKMLDAIFDIFSWYVLIVGLIMLALGGTIGTVGKYAAIAGAATLILTQGRNEKNIVKRLMSGIISLYSITGYMSDVLSYSRLLALGLATGVVASVINTMGTLFGLNIAGIIILVIVFVVGTVFNIAINALGAYVHSSRLQYVEFFGKFYEGGGKAFQPFKINTKYIELEDKEMI